MRTPVQFMPVHGAAVLAPLQCEAILLAFGGLCHVHTRDCVSQLQSALPQVGRLL